MRSERLRRQTLLLHASFCAIVLRAALRTLPLPVAVRLAASLSTVLPARAPGRTCLAAARWATRTWSHPTCLYRAVTTYALLAHRADVVFHIGVSPRDSFGAHAWVSVAGHPVDRTAARYASLWAASVSNRAS
jgi:hypothetical protein